MSVSVVVECLGRSTTPSAKDGNSKVKDYCRPYERGDNGAFKMANEAIFTEDQFIRKIPQLLLEVNKS
jgi:hypothetical protein